MWNFAIAQKTMRGNAGRSIRGRRRPTLEVLEGRVVLSATPTRPNIAVLSAREQTATSVAVVYQVQNAPIAKSFEIAIDRSRQPRSTPRPRKLVMERPAAPVCPWARTLWW